MMKFSDQFEDSEIQMLDIPEDESGSPSVVHQERDLESQLPIHSYSNGPIKSGDEFASSNKIIKFKLNPTQYNGVLFVSEDMISKTNDVDSSVYQLDIPGYDTSSAYIAYITTLYKTLESLGDLDQYSYSHKQPTIGLISITPDYSETKQLNSAFETIIESLIALITAKKSSDPNDDAIYGLEELLFILDCLYSSNFVDNATEKPNYLATWINRANPKPVIEDVTEIMTSEKPYLHNDFWSSYLPKLLTRGLFNQATRALEQSGFEELKDTDYDLYLTITDLKTILSNYYITKKGQFNEWKASACEVRDNLNRGSYNNNLIAKYVFDIFGIITGLPKTIAEYCETWYEMYVALSLFQVRGDDSLYSEYYRTSISELPPNSAPDPDQEWELTCIDILESNYLKVIRRIEELDGATAAYVAKFCEAKGLFDTYSNEYSVLNNLDGDKNKSPSIVSISDYLLNNHALDSLNIRPLVPIGLGILMNSKTAQARATISEFLPTYYCDTNDDLEWVLSICAKLEIPSIAQVIFKLAARRSLGEGYLFEALSLFARADDVESVRNSSWMIFEDSLLRGGSIDDEIINNVVAGKADLDVHPVVRQCLSPYAILRSFYHIYRTGSVRSSIIQLISLLKFIHLPTKYFPLLLSHLLPFISSSCSPRILTLQELVVIIELINNYSNSVSKEDYENGEALYQYAIQEDNLEKVVDNQQDWRTQLTNNGIAIPFDLKGLIVLLRKNIATEIGRTYLEEA